MKESNRNQHNDLDRKLYFNSEATWNVLCKLYFIQRQPLANLLQLESALERTIQIAQAYGIVRIKIVNKKYECAEIIFNSTEFAVKYIHHINSLDNGVPAYTTKLGLILNNKVIKTSPAWLEGSPSAFKTFTFESLAVGVDDLRRNGYFTYSEQRFKKSLAKTKGAIIHELKAPRTALDLIIAAA